MTHDGNHIYFYDAENRTIQVDGTLGNCAAATACYAYDAEGRRIQKTVGSVVTQYVYDVDGQVIHEADGAGNFTAYYIPFAGQLLAQYKNSTTQFIHKDHLGSTRLVTGMTNPSTPVDTLDFLPFGEQLAGDTATTHKFTGKERDSESGLDNFGARFDSSTLGRFMSPDPGNAGASDDNPQSWNGYSYALNNPLTAIDSDGREVVFVVCDTDGHCSQQMTQEQFEAFLKNSPNLVYNSEKRLIYSKNDDGTANLVGGYYSYNNDAEIVDASMKFFSGLFASNYLRLLGPLAKLGLAGRGITTLGVDSAVAVSANAVEAAATEAASLTTKAASVVGNQGATASSRAVALQAAEEWVGPGARPIVDRTTGQVVGKISADGLKVFRITSLNKPQPYVNLVNRATGGNLHVRF
jgi:RHS repeat-associated protein